MVSEYLTLALEYIIIPVNNTTGLNVAAVMSGSATQTPPNIYPQITGIQQKWFWTDAWQAGERHVEDHITHGEIEAFDNMDAFLQSLPRNE